MKKNSKTSIFHTIFILLFAAVFIYYIVFQFILPAQVDRRDQAIDVTNLWNWEQVLSDGTRISLDSPNAGHSEKGTYVIETTLPEEIPYYYYIGTRSSQQELLIIVNGEERLRYSTRNTQLRGKNSASAYVLAPLSDHDGGQTLRIEYSTSGAYAEYINKIYFGTQWGIIKHHIDLYWVSVVITIFLLVFSLLATIYSIAFSYRFHAQLSFTSLSLAILVTAVYLTSSSMLRQLVVPNISVASDVSFFSSLFIMVPFLFFTDEIQHFRYRKLMTSIEAVITFLSIVSIILYFTTDIDLVMLSFVSVANLLVSIGVIAITLIRDIIKKKELYLPIAIGLLATLPLFMLQVVSSYTDLPMLIDVISTSLYSIGIVGLLLLHISREVRGIVKMSAEKREADKSNQSKSGFLANMSHEIRTPLNSIMGMNEMMLREAKDENLRNYAENIRTSSELLLGIINDILDFSKIESGKMNIVETEYKTANTVSNLVMILKERAEKKGLNVQLRISSEIPSVLMGDEIRIKQIIINLISNATKYTKEGTVTLAINSTTQGDQCMLNVMVRDTGIGMKQEDLQKLFDKFTRIEEKKNINIEGTGLGMSIVKNLLDLMGGTIQVESVYEKGTTFKISIPQKIVSATPMGSYETATTKKEELKEYQEKFTAPNARILVVDDVAMNRTVVAALLKKSQIQVDMADGAAKALILCNENFYDLILMDHMMPEIDGVEAFHMLRNGDSINHNTKVIVLTANAISGMKEAYLAEGFTDYLSKPVKPDALEEMLIKYLPKEKVLEPTRTDVRPIGVFDSGVGGISVLKELTKLLPNEQFIYFGDSANAPYGTKPTIEVENLTCQTADLLITQNVKALVIACNTATAAAVHILRKRYPKIPVIGIEPALKPAVLHNPNGLVVVMATEVTLNEAKFNNLLEQYKDQADIRTVSCPNIVDRIELGDTSSPRLRKYISERLESILHEGETLQDIQSVVLGCTHYPFIKPLLSELLSEDCYIVDGGEGTARETKRQLETQGLLAGEEGKGSVEILNSNETKIAIAEKLYYGE